MKIIEEISIPTKSEGIKNKVEIENIVKVMVKDGMPLQSFSSGWNTIMPVPMSELSIDEKLEHFPVRAA